MGGGRAKQEEGRRPEAACREEQGEAASDGKVESRTVRRRRCHGDDELPTVAELYRAFISSGRLGP